MLAYEQNAESGHPVGEIREEGGYVLLGHMAHNATKSLTLRLASKIRGTEDKTKWVD